MHVVEQRTARVGSTWLHHLYNVRAFLGYLPAFYKGGLDSFVISSFFLQEETGNCCVCVLTSTAGVCVYRAVYLFCIIGFLCIFIWQVHQLFIAPKEA